MSQLRSALMVEVQQLFGRDPVRLFQDTSTIAHGASWEREIRKAISQSVFFVPILTPNFIQSEWCCREVELFLDREAQLTSTYEDGTAAGRIFPILYIGIDEAEPVKPEILDHLRQRQELDFRRFRHQSHDEPAVREALSGLALNISRLLRLKLSPREGGETAAPPSVSPAGGEAAAAVAAVADPADGARETRRRKPGRDADRPEASSIGVGDVLNDMFEVTRFIKSGGMGQVFEGRNVKTGERVAIKTLLPTLAADPKIVKFFYREALTLTRLHHEAVVQYRVLAEAPRQGVLYIVTEFIDGVELSEAIRRGRPSPDQVLALTRRLASGLAAAHRLGAVHRDMSLDNVMLPDGELARAKIIDFGIAKDISDGASTILGPAFGGKLGYAAPEQLGEHGGEVGTWTDVYSLGLVILAAARGEAVDMGRTLAEAVHKRREALDLSAVPESLRSVLADMLQPDPAARLRTMDDVIRALPAAAPGDSGRASSPFDVPVSPETEVAGTEDGAEPTRLIESPATRRPPRAAILAGAIGLMVLGVASMFWINPPDPEPFSRAELNQADWQVRPPVARPCGDASAAFVFFAGDEVALGPLDRAQLDDVVANRHPRHLITVIRQSGGASGDAAGMARRRANMIAAYLVQRGVPRSSITVLASLEAGGRIGGVRDGGAARYKITAECR